ncbi:MAG: hypothetical protein ACE5G8_14320, partial [Anaerolineae bacterium]
FGSVVASSEREVASVVQVRWEGGTSADGKTAAAYNSSTRGTNKLYFPSLAARPGKQFSRITIQSAAQPSTSQTADITIRYYSRDGTLNATFTDTLFLGAQQTYDLSLTDQDPNDKVPDNLPPFTVDGWLGAAIVESNSPIVGTTSMHWQDYSAAYTAPTGGGTKIYLPSGTRRKPLQRPGFEPWLQYTSIIVQNLDAAATANVKLTWFDRLGNTLHVFTDTIPANASHGYNTRFTGSNVPDHTALHTALTDDWNGSLAIESLAPGAEIIAIANLQWTEDHPTKAAASTYASEAAGYTRLFAPAAYRRGAGVNWAQYTGLIVQNIGQGACNNFAVQWRDRNNVKVLEYADTLPVNIAHGYNTRFGADVPVTSDVADLTGDFLGSVYIDAPGCSLIGIHNTVWPAWTDGTTYNTVGQ